PHPLSRTHVGVPVGRLAPTLVDTFLRSCVRTASPSNSSQGGERPPHLITEQRKVLMPLFRGCGGRARCQGVIRVAADGCAEPRLRSIVSQICFTPVGVASSPLSASSSLGDCC